MFVINNANNEVRNENRLVGIHLVAVVLLAVGVMAEAQQPKKVPRIGYLVIGSKDTNPPLDSFRQGLRELGYIEGQKYRHRLPIRGR